MVNSCNAVTSNDMVTGTGGGGDLSSSPLMTRSLDPTLLYTSSSLNQDTNNRDQSEGSSAQRVLENGGAGMKYEFLMSTFFFLGGGGVVNIQLMTLVLTDLKRQYPSLIY
jgi:hypothetical protein